VQAEHDHCSAGHVEHEQRQRDGAHHERVRGRNAHAVVRQLAEQADVSQHDGAERHTRAQQVHEEKKQFQHGSP
jgi:hypothetical protein